MEGHLSLGFAVRRYQLLRGSGHQFTKRHSQHLVTFNDRGPGQTRASAHKLALRDPNEVITGEVDEENLAELAAEDSATVFVEGLGRHRMNLPAGG